MVFIISGKGFLKNVQFDKEASIQASKDTKTNQ